MSEIIYTYPIDNPNKIEPMDRREFYIEQSALKLPTKYVGVIGGMIINTKGEIIIQKRSGNKGHNPGMYDKSLGGHIQYGSDAYRTMLEEMIEELGIPCFPARNESEFLELLEMNKAYLNQIAVTRDVGQSIRLETKIIGGNKVLIGNKINFFIGISNVTPKFNDGEVESTQAITLEDLEQELINDTKHTVYTDDLRSILKHHRGSIIAARDIAYKL